MRLTFIRLHAENAGPYEKLDVDFNTGFTRLTGNNLDVQGSNGAGKSTLIKLFFYALFGETPNGQKAKELISDTLPGELLVSLEFAADGTRYSVTRGPKTLLLEDPHFPDLKNRPDVQPRINEILGLSQEALLMLTLFNSESIKFAGATPATRRDLFTSIFSDLRQYQLEYAERFRDAIKEQQRQSGLYGAEINKIEGQAAAVRAEMERISNQLTGITSPDAAAEAQIAGLRQEEAACKGRLAEAMERLAKVFSAPDLFAARSYVREAAAFDKSYVTSSQHKEELVWELRQQTAALARGNAALSAAKDRLQNLDASLVDKVCPTCGQRIEGELAQLQATRDKYQAEILAAETEVQKCQTGVTAVETQLGPLAEWLEQNEATYSALQALKEVLEMADAAERDLSQVQTALITAQMAPRESETLRQHLHDQLAAAEVKLNELAVTYNECMSWYGQIQHSIEGLQHLVKVSQNDIPNALISAYLERLEYESSDVLGRIFPGMSIQISDSRTTGKGATKYETNILITNTNGKTKRYETFSDGEKQAINIALLFGLQRLVIQDTNTFVNVLFLDEAVDLSVDAVRLEEIVAFLEGEAPTYDFMLLISHKLDLQAAFDTCMTAVKQNGVSSLVVEN